MDNAKNETETPQPFVCANCNHVVTPFSIGNRNHCPNCLFSLHTDIFPGDNANACHGLMQPVGTLQTEEGVMLVVHKCHNCGKSARAMVALDDNYEVILTLLPSEEN